MTDKTSIHTHTAYAEGKHHGYVDMGCGVKDDGVLAKDALVLMAVSVNETFKVPLGYFLIKSLTGEERANLIQECLTRLQETGVEVLSLTCDGPPCNMTMLKQLGVKVNVDNMDTSFHNPEYPTKKIHAFLDVCHMVKLLRNAFGDGLVFRTPEGEVIRWQYIEDLVKLQGWLQNHINPNLN